jgi:nitroimidazol reductase NimA-like FMN-containing flavoprotein (pyridoxamine 5'-phosphate oxidase superfamily)
MFKAGKEVKDPSVMEGLLGQCRWMSIALSGPDGPYIFTLSYGYDIERNALYFHTARTGLKLELLRNDPRACGTIIEDLGYLHGKCSHAYRSLVVFGRISFVDGAEEIDHAFNVLLDHQEREPGEVKREFLGSEGAARSAQILRFDIESMRCKQGGVPSV